MASNGADSGAPAAIQPPHTPIDVESQLQSPSAQYDSPQVLSSSPIPAADGATFHPSAGLDAQTAVPTAATVTGTDEHVSLPKSNEEDDDDTVGDLPAAASGPATGSLAYLRSAKKNEIHESEPKRVRIDAPPPAAKVPYRQSSGMTDGELLYRQSSGLSPDFGPGPSSPQLVAPHKPGKSVPITAYNSPKDTLLACIKAGQAKSILPLWQMMMLAFNAGLFLSFGSLAGLVVGGEFSGAGRDSMAKFVYASMFPIGLVIIVLAGGELFTGNVMYLSTALAAGKARPLYALRNLAVVWLCNFLGAAACAFFLAYLPELVSPAPQLAFLRSMATKKMTLGWGAMFLRGVGCNWLVCLAFWSNLTAKDIRSKIVALWLPISTFVWIGWEHAPANMFSLSLALMEGVSGKHFGDALAWNIIPATLGNFLGGLLFAMGQFAVYGNYAAPQIGQLFTRHAVERQAKKEAAAAR